MSSKFRKMLMQLGMYIKDRDLKAVKYYMNDIIGKRDMEHIESVVDLWEALEQRNKICPKNVDLLKNLLNVCYPDRVDMRNILEDYMRSVGMNVDVQPVNEHMTNKMHHVGHASFPKDYDTDYSGPPELESCITYLTKKLGRNWKFLVRNLHVDESEINEAEFSSPSNLREQIYCCLKKWLLKQQQMSAVETGHMLDILQKALTGVGRIDLVEDIQNKKYMN